jgi:signal transduction histidine kinase
MNKFRSIGALLSVVTGLLVILLITVFAYAAKKAYDRREHAALLLRTVDVLDNVFAASEALRLEQGEINAALTRPEPADAPMLAKIVQLHRNVEDALRRTHESANLEANGNIPDLAPILRAGTHYRLEYAKALMNIRRPVANRTAMARNEWSESVNVVLALVNKHTRERSMYIADASALNNEMTKIVRMAWSMREVIGLDRVLLADAINNRQRISSEQLQKFAEQEGNLNYPWGVLKSDRTELPTFPAGLKQAVDVVGKIYFREVRPERRRILDALGMGRVPPYSVSQWLNESDRALRAIRDVVREAFVLTRQSTVTTLEEANREFYLALLLMLLSFGLSTFSLIYVIFQVIRPLQAIAGAMRAVAEGDLAHRIPYPERRDEIGEFARALCQFRYNVIERRRLEEDLREHQIAKESAEASSRIKSQFLANMSHELRTPLNAIIGFSELTRNQIYGPLQRQYREYANIIFESGHHLLHLVSDILDISKIEAGKFVLDISDLDLAENVDYCIRLMKGRAAERGIILKTSLPAGKCTFPADRRAFRQILLNLLSNAIKFSRPNAEVKVTVEVVTEKLILAVRDYGIGMSENLLARIGRPFEQAVNDPVRAREGAGLGLSLVFALIHHHGGSVRIESQEGLGTTVTCEFPLVGERRSGAETAA